MCLEKPFVTVTMFWQPLDGSNYRNMSICIALSGPVICSFRFALVSGWVLYRFGILSCRIAPKTWSISLNIYSGSCTFVCAPLLSWSFQDNYHTLRVSSGVLDQQAALVWELDSIWHYRFVRSVSGTKGLARSLCDPHLLYSFCFVCLLSVALLHKAGPKTSASKSSVLGRRHVLLKIVHFFVCICAIRRSVSVILFKFLDASCQRGWFLSCDPFRCVMLALLFVEGSVLVFHSRRLLGSHRTVLHQRHPGKMLLPQWMLSVCLTGFWDVNFFVTFSSSLKRKSVLVLTEPAMWASSKLKCNTYSDAFHNAGGRAFVRKRRSTDLLSVRQIVAFVMSYRTCVNSWNAM